MRKSKAELFSVLFQVNPFTWLPACRRIGVRSSCPKLLPSFNKTAGTGELAPLNRIAYETPRTFGNRFLKDLSIPLASLFLVQSQWEIAKTVLPTRGTLILSLLRVRGRRRTPARACTSRVDCVEKRSRDTH